MYIIFAFFCKVFFVLYTGYLILCKGSYENENILPWNEILLAGIHIVSCFFLYLNLSSAICCTPPFQIKIFPNFFLFLFLYSNFFKIFYSKIYFIIFIQNFLFQFFFFIFIFFFFKFLFFYFSCRYKKYFSSNAEVIIYLINDINSIMLRVNHSFGKKLVFSALYLFIHF